MVRIPLAVRDEKRQRLLQFLAQGHTRRTAAMLTQIDEDTVRRWELADAEYAEKIRAAEIAACAVAEASIHAAVQDDWRAALAYLERRDPEQWAKRNRVEHSGTVTHAHYVERAREATQLFTPDQIVAFVEGHARELPDAG